MDLVVRTFKGENGRQYMAGEIVDASNWKNVVKLRLLGYLTSYSGPQVSPVVSDQNSEDSQINRKERKRL